MESKIAHHSIKYNLRHVNLFKAIWDAEVMLTREMDRKWVGQIKNGAIV
jgi:hypothetical protein